MNDARDTSGGSRYAAFLRGINVGVAKRVTMPALKAAFERAGMREVSTLLASGNVAFSSPEPCAHVRELVAAELHREFGAQVEVALLSDAEVATLVAENPFREREKALSYSLVALFPRPAEAREALAGIGERDWLPEAVEVGALAAFMWCPNGTTASKVAQAVGRALGDNATVRSFGTITKMAGLLGRERV